MSHLEVRLTAEPAAYRPGDVLEGEASWKLDQPTPALNLKVYWTTDGDSGLTDPPVLAHDKTFPISGLEGKQAFHMDLPQGPWSFQGKVFSVRWFVEIGLEEDFRSRTEFVLGPEGRAIRIADGAGDADPSGPSPAS
jgi:hypothetical protein